MMRFLTFLLLSTILVVSISTSATAQMNKHDTSIAKHRYSVFIATGKSSQVKDGNTLSDDVDQGLVDQTFSPVLIDNASSESAVDKNEIDEPVALSSKKAVFAKGISDLEAVINSKNILREGHKAKDFALPNAQGSFVNLSDELAKGPVVLVWYRGGWCPYCNIQLRAFQNELSKIEAASAQLIAISPEVPDNSLTTSQKNDLKFHVLSDANNDVARSYGLTYRVADDVLGYLPDLASHNGNDGKELPLTATYVVDTDGTIAYAYINPDYRERAEPADVVAALGDLAAKKSQAQMRAKEKAAAMAQAEAQAKAEKAEMMAQEKAKMEAEALAKAQADALVEEQKKIMQEETVAPVEIETSAPTSLTKPMEDVVETIEGKDIAPALPPEFDGNTSVKDTVKLKPLVATPEGNVEPSTTLEVRAKEEGLIPESY